MPPTSPARYLRNKKSCGSVGTAPIPNALRALQVQGVSNDEFCD